LFNPNFYKQILFGQPIGHGSISTVKAVSIDDDDDDDDDDSNDKDDDDR